MLIDDLSDETISPELKTALAAWGLERLTHIQMLALESGIQAGVSQVVCAPTSSGKTLVGEIAIWAALNRGLRCLYLVSHKALADQKYFDFVDRFGEEAPHPLASVGLSTGDRDEGEVSPQILVATYERALALVLAGQVDTNALVVVADELQIIDEVSRGPNIETLCTILRQRGVDQFIALTATVGNPEDLADWLDCRLVETQTRDVDLHQEIWARGEGFSVKFGNNEGEECHADAILPNDPIDAVRKLLELNRGPILVFTESRREASMLANRYSATLARTASGIAMAQQLELFSEPTESSQQLQQNAQKRVAFHTADLTTQERQVIEQGFSDSEFDVCFATSTLAAGVNFPFRSVVFPKLTYSYGDRQGRMLVRSDYRNMSGRAGRLGLHDDGFAVLLPQNLREINHANNLVLPDNDNIESKFVGASMRRSVLALVSSQVVTKRSEIRTFFESTLYWHQIRERNPNKLDDVIDLSLTALDWLENNGLVESNLDNILPTPIGRATAQSGLLPSTAVSFLTVLEGRVGEMEANFENFIPGLIHWACQCDEFTSKRPSRFLPYPGRGVTNSTGFLQARLMLAPLNRADDRTNQSAYAVTLYCQGDAERAIRHATNISSGQLHRLAVDVAWVFDGLRRIASVPELEVPQTLTNKLSMLARQVQWGAPAEALDMLRIAQRERVPGFGRQRAIALLRNGIRTFEDLFSKTKASLVALLGNDKRTDALLDAAATCGGLGGSRYQQVHQELAGRLGLSEMVAECETTLGNVYEDAVRKLLEVEKSWTIRVIDDGKQQNVPDLLIELEGLAVLLECKTTTKKPPLINKEDAYAVLQKAADFDTKISRITLGKPAFDEHSKKKALGAVGVSLVEHDPFIEGLLRVHARETSAMAFLQWIANPGVAELDRLEGRSSFQLLAGGA